MSIACDRREISLDNSCIDLTSVVFTIYNEDKPNSSGRNQGWSICEDCAQRCPDFVWNQGRREVFYETEITKAARRGEYGCK